MTPHVAGQEQRENTEECQHTEVAGSSVEDYRIVRLPDQLDNNQAG